MLIVAFPYLEPLSNIYFQRRRPHHASDIAVFTPGLGGELLSNGLECHYPLLQIVDGNGTRTKYYADYLAYVGNGTTCDEPSFECPVNQAPGTVLLGRLVA